MRKVKPGDALRFPAATFNAFVDAARFVKELQHGVGGLAGRAMSSQDVVLVKNASGGDYARGGALSITGVVYSPTDNLDGFKAKPVLSGVTPTADMAGDFVVALEPIPDGKIGRSVISGLAIAQVSVSDAGHGFADTQSDSLLASYESGGAAQIIWKEAGTGTKWAVLRISNLSAPAPAAVAGFLAKVIASLGGSGYTVREQVATGAATFADAPGAVNLTAHNLAELSLGSGAAVDNGTILIVRATLDNGSPPTTRHVFDHPAYAKYLD